MSIGNLFRPTAHVAAPTGAPKGSVILLTSLSWVNTWNVEPGQFVIDGEWMRAAASLSFLLTERFELGVQVPVLGRMSGFADGFIEGFHKALALGNGRRERYPRNRSIVHIRGPGGQHACWYGDQWGVSDVGLFASWTMTQGGRFAPRVSIGCAANLPTGDEDELLGSGSSVLGASVFLTKRIEASRWLLFLGSSAMYSDKKEMAGIDLQNAQFTVLGGFEYECSNRLSLICQNLTTSPVAHDYYEFSKATHELVVGARVRGFLGGDCEIGLQENLLNFNNSADVGLHAAFRRVL